jgi:hypothetical protein
MHLTQAQKLAKMEIWSKKNGKNGQFLPMPNGRREILPVFPIFLAVFVTEFSIKVEIQFFRVLSY